MNDTALTIAQVLPHAGHMLLLDELLSHSDMGVVTAVTIRSNSVLCDADKGVPAWVGMEYMAQATCAYSGLFDVRAGEKPKISLLLGTRSFKTNLDFFPIESRLIVTAELVMQGADELFVFKCRVLCNGEEWAECDIKAIRPHNVHMLIQEQLNEQSKQ